MMDFDILTPEEKFKFGGWLYNMLEGWNDPDWWSKHNAERYGHVLNVTFTSS